MRTCAGGMAFALIGRAYRANRALRPCSRSKKFALAVMTGLVVDDAEERLGWSWA